MTSVLIRVGVPLILYFLQGTLFPSLFGGFLRPELLLCWLLSWSLLSGTQEGLFMGLFSGFLMDLSSSSFFGFYIFLGGFLGWISGRAREQVNHDTVMLPVAFILGGTLTIQSLLLLISMFTHFSFFMLGFWILHVLQQALWNLVFVLPIYGLATYLWYRFCR